MNKANKDKLASINRLIDWYSINKPSVTEIYTGLQREQIEKLGIHVPKGGGLITHRGFTLKPEAP